VYPGRVAESRELKRELGLFDLVLTQVLYIVGLSWVGVAAKLGEAHVVYWLIAIALFYIPSALVVIHLGTRMPIEGGLYEWSRHGFGEMTGFLVGWNLWVYILVLLSTIGLVASTNLTYMLGPKAAWLAQEKWFISAIALVLTVALMLVSTIGWSIGRWIHGASAIVMLAMFAVLIALPLIRFVRGEPMENRPFALAAPPVSLFSLNILGKLGFAALGGFEYVALFAGECRDPIRTIGRSVIVAAPICALMFILGTGSVLALVGREKVDLVSPVAQTLNAGTRELGLIANVVPIVILSVLITALGKYSVWFAGNCRLPMVAGWDHLLPEWFTRLSPRHRTPVNSILFGGVMMIVIGLGGIVGVGQQEAYQLLDNTSGILYGLTYLVMFAIPIFGASKTRGPNWLRVVSASGFAMTLLYVLTSIFPIIPVVSRALFTTKIVGVILIVNALGVGVFVANRRATDTLPQP